MARSMAASYAGKPLDLRNFTLSTSPPGIMDDGVFGARVVRYARRNHDFAVDALLDASFPALELGGFGGNPLRLCPLARLRLCAYALGFGFLLLLLEYRGLPHARFFLQPFLVLTPHLFLALLFLLALGLFLQRSSSCFARSSRLRSSSCLRSSSLSRFSSCLRSICALRLLPAAAFFS